MTEPPAYFEAIQEGAARRWLQLEADPELAGPWHQLFAQVQSPRHIVSELLQNADDAGATAASVRIDGDRFVFSHDGEDFKPEHFASLCRFGYSNKRALHTIGFRGIGFKSTFSVGEPVRLRTPTLSVEFRSARFTEPYWVEDDRLDWCGTEVSVPISDARRRRELEKNLEEWLASPVSLLFFKNLRSLRVGDREVEWASLGPGPTSGTEWMALTEDPDTSYLVAASDEEPFPEDALVEIRSERMLSPEQEADFPPARVEIVLGAPGRLYVVLPTGVKTELPFACNAPFIQDPARMKIKDPETSPTNRWLLKRAGALAAAVMLRWVRNEGASVPERSGAYALVPKLDHGDGSLEGACATHVADAFDGSISGEPFLLTNSGALQVRGECVAFPSVLLEVWPANEVAPLFDARSRPALSPNVGATERAKLVGAGYVPEVTRSQVVEVLTTRHVPAPATWRPLLRLWAFVAPALAGWQNATLRPRIRIAPVQGKDTLYSSSQIVRLGDKRLLRSEEDWDFLAPHLLALNGSWVRYVLDQQREATERGDAALSRETFLALQLLQDTGLIQAADPNQALEQIAKSFFASPPFTVASCVRLAHIAAKLGASAGASFRFLSRDRQFRPTSHKIYHDPDGSLEELLPASVHESHLLHGGYVRDFQSCTAEEWKAWVSSGRSGLLSFPPLEEQPQTFWAKDAVVAEMRRRGFEGTPTYWFKSSRFQINDWDFAAETWKHWTHLATSDERVWGRILERIASLPPSFVSGAQNARAYHVSTQSTTRLLTSEPLLPQWALKLRELRCLPDTRGTLHKPGDLLRRTPATEALLEVEPFVHGRLDTEANRTLLELLGVRATPTGPRRLLACLRALALSKTPPVTEVDKWYRRLDQLLDSCSTEERSEVATAFRDEDIILSEDGGWAKLTGVFLAADEDDAPGAPMVRAAVRHLALWRKLGVAERPTADLAIAWLRQLPSGGTLPASDARRARALLGRHAVRVWKECRHWLSLNGRWMPVEELRYTLSMRSLVGRQHLHESVRERTADLQTLSAELTSAAPFSELPTLASVIEERFDRSARNADALASLPWLNEVGRALQRVAGADANQAERLRALGEAFAQTRWQVVPDLEIVPYIDGVPAGTPQRAEVVWRGRELFVAPLPTARLAKLIPARLGADDADVSAALSYCFGRGEHDVQAYMEENFSLAPRDTFVGAEKPPEAVPSSLTEAAETPTAKPIDSRAASGDDEIQPPGVNGTGADSPWNTVPEPNGAPGPQDDAPGPVRPKPPTRPPQPSLLERFALARGYRREATDRFTHPDGGWLSRASGDLFPWERRNRAGTLTRRYWVKDHCLDQEPLQLPADLWAFLEKNPTTCSLLLLDHAGNPLELPGERLRRMRETGEITLYPAAYRLVRAR